MSIHSLNIVDKRLLFVLYMLISVLVTYTINTIIITDQYYFDFLGQQLTSERIKQFLSFRDKWQWIGYFIVPLLLFLKISAVSFSVHLGSIISETILSFKKLFGMVLIAEGIFILAALIRMLLLWVSNFSTLEEIQAYYPLSLLNMFDITRLKPWELYIYQQINLFHAIYILALTYGYHKLAHKKFINCLLFILSTYGLGVVLWVTLLIYFAVTLS